MIKEYKGKKPIINDSCFTADSADIIGDIVIGEHSSVWYNAVLRGDANQIKIGRNTNIQDNTVVHVSDIYQTEVGDNVTIGHSAIIHACKIGDDTLIGMGAIILDGSEVGSQTIIGAGSLVPQGKKIPSGVLAVGSPAKIIRELTEDEKKSLLKSAQEYVQYAENHKK
ncbi:gamma carbonic anhydrase family protein [Serpentinicella sp. ANB-PHB4]|uniref:gamma carbonic anhydrase family protein n=1 Tax=Serpentinicella sp. ANB-PHB4 TaxID=3074076 RepID=UPI00285EF8E6|nr:gamma carbonic anhydrase family protein [Serpentinicella sp. ANB-PHB4]MDR5658064.1 gamma carbonic anhydrase family protein [Serpentinicella sp. ANB-PHB4]